MPQHPIDLKASAPDPFVTARLRPGSQLERTVALPSPYDFDASMRFVPFGLYGPSCRVGPGVLWRAAHTPRGPVTLHLLRQGDHVRARAWGPGGDFALERVPALLGLDDDPAAFRPQPAPLATLARRGRGLRLSRSPWVFDVLSEYVLQQRVSFRDAARAHGRLVGAFGAAAPGPPGLRLPLLPRDWLGLTSDDFRHAGVDGQRTRTLRAAARHARAVDAAFELDKGVARAAIASIPGCGPWTVEMTMGFGLGDSDAVPVGDLHLPDLVAQALVGDARADDARMLELLAPYAGQRFRLIRLLLATGRIRLGPRGG